GHGNYQYNYDITDWDTNHKRWETVDANNNRRGGYTITDVDGKVRQVEYTADKNGFRAIVKTNEHGTKSHVTGDHDAIYVRDGVSKIIQDAQPALQQTGHVLKQKKLGHAHHVVGALPIVPAAPVAPIVTHHARPVVEARQPLVHTTVVQPAPVQVALAPPPLAPVVVHRPIIHETVIQRAPEPVIPVAPKRTVAYIPPIINRPIPAPPRPLFEHVHRVVHQPPPATIRIEPAVEQAPVIVKQPATVDIPAYTGPRRRLQKFIIDPSQAFETPPEKVLLTPKRVPAYAPDQDLPEDFGVNVPTVPPPASRLRTAYAPEKIIVKSAPITRFAPIAIRPVYRPTYSYGPAYHTTSYQPVSYTPSRCSRCSGYAKAKSRARTTLYVYAGSTLQQVKQDAVKLGQVFGSKESFLRPETHQDDNDELQAVEGLRHELQAKIARF
ncbi:hypothetical protein BIW11_05231, partial [Tropilaelaps mercedesae]